MNEETFCKTVVGSQIWGMQRPDSDTDYWKVYIAPSEDFLIGKRHVKGHEHNVEGDDYSSFEIGHVVNQLKGMNLNFLQGVMSPIVVEAIPEHEQLRRLVSDNLAKNCYNSIHGMCFSNYKKYFEHGEKLSKDEEYKKLGQIGRVIEFGVRILNGEGVSFESHRIDSRYDVLKMIDRLDDAKASSPLPERPDEKAFDDFLLKLRMRKLCDGCKVTSTQSPNNGVFEAGMEQMMKGNDRASK